MQTEEVDGGGELTNVDGPKRTMVMMMVVVVEVVEVVKWRSKGGAVNHGAKYLTVFVTYCIPLPFTLNPERKGGDTKKKSLMHTLIAATWDYHTKPRTRVLISRYRIESAWLFGSSGLELYLQQYLPEVPT